MLNGALLKKTVCLTTIVSFALANLPKTAEAYGYRLSPESFDQMYYLAQSGKVEALRASVHRGLNIDVMNDDGDTGLCVAARRHDFYAYNSFRAAGANPRHPCTQSIHDYDDFTTSSRTVPVTSTPREAYGATGNEQYSLSPKFWWWVGGAALVGGGVAIALSSGGGGGHKDSGGDSGGGGEEYHSLGAIAGTQGKIRETVSESSASNTVPFIETKNSNTEKISVIDFNHDVLNNSEYLDVVLDAKNSGKYTNNTNMVLKMGEGVVGMNSSNKSQINNFGFINIESYNASIGMVASEDSIAANYGTGIIGDSSALSSNGIALNFSGYKDSNTIIGMYADNKSVIQNYGDIRGTAIEASSKPSQNSTNDDSSSVSASAAQGSIVGMEVMIVNAGKDLNKNTSYATNEISGKINLSAGDSGAGGNEIKVSLIGIGSFLDKGFMDGSKSINRAEKVNLQNNGIINLGYTGNYTVASDSSLRKGTGGIVGIRADANTTAYNAGYINISLDEYSSSSSNVSVAGGMQSIHGANLYNSGYINIVTSAGNQKSSYGMISVEGSGTVSELYTDLNQKLENSGDIYVQASNSYGMASFNGGTLKNTKNIVLGKKDTTTQYEYNIAMYGYGRTTEATLENKGTISLYSHDSVAMQNDFGGGTSIYNSGIINIYESATNSYVFGGAYSEVHNSNTINYYANSTGTPSSEGTKNNPFKNYTLSIGHSVISTSGKTMIKNAASVASSSTTEKIYNDENAVINMDGASFIAGMYVEKHESEEKTQGKAYNNGTININDSILKSATNVVGMYLGKGSINNSFIANNGTITTNSKFSAAMASSSTENASILNTGTISTNKEYSLGIYSSDFTNINNSGKIYINGDYSTAIYTTGKTGSSTITNDNEINIGSSSNSPEYSYGIYADENSWHRITNNGTINTYAKNKGIAVYSAAADNDNDKSNYVINKGNINVLGNKNYGIFVENDIYVTNLNNASINVGTEENPVYGSYGIYSNFENNKLDYEYNGEIINQGTINIYSVSADAQSYGIYSKGALIRNEGHINVNNGVAVTGDNIYFINEEGYDVYANNSNVISNVLKAVNRGNISGTNGNGIYATDPVEIVNNGTIEITQDGDGIHVIVTAVDKEVKIINTGTITVDSGYAIYVEKNYELNKKEEVEEGKKKITYTDNTIIEAGGATVQYGGACMPHCINGEVEYVDSNNVSTSSVGYALLSSNSGAGNIVFTNSINSMDENTGKELGFSMIPNLAQQSFDIEKTVNSELNDDLISATNKKIRHQANIVAYKNKVNSKHEVSGYKDTIVAAYGFYDKALNDNIRLGFALNAVRSDSDFDDGSYRYNNMLELSAPIIFNNNVLSALLKPKVGFARGHYRRSGINQSYKAKTKEFYYGFDSEVRHNIDINYFSIEPNAGFNFTGLYSDDIKESKNGLRIKDRNNISAPVSLGLNIKKSFVLDSHNSLMFTAGGKYFHEFGNKDNRRVFADNTTVFYNIKSNRLQRNYGLLTFKASYSYDDFIINASANAPLKQKNNPFYLLNLGYKF